jgi:hypothetical protein
MSAVPGGARADAPTASVPLFEEGRGPMPDADPHVPGPEPGPETAAPHPEEMKATVDLRLGRSVSIRATGRATPAGLATAAMLVSALLIPLVWLARNRARDRIRAG